jgi:hypothetical protein
LIFVTTRADIPAYGTAPPGSAASLLEHSVSQVLAADASVEDRYTVMLRAWSLVHGLAMLILDKQVAADDALIDLVICETSLGFDVGSQ